MIKLTDAEIAHQRQADAAPASAGVPEGWRQAAAFIEKKAQDYINDNAENEPDTGAIVWNCGEAGRDYHSSLVELAEELIAAATVRGVQADKIAQYQSGDWFTANTVDEMQAFYLSRLSAIREAAKEHGYAIGLHGSMRRDFDLMAMQWRDNASDKDTLAHAIAKAACGITRDGPFQWEQKPCGRFAVSIPVCWTDHANPDLKKPSAGHIDLSIIDAAPSVQAVSSDEFDLLVVAADRLQSAARNFNASKFVRGSAEHHAAAHEYQAAQDNLLRTAIAAEFAVAVSSDAGDRERFEAHIKNVYGERCAITYLQSTNGHYAYSFIQHDWSVWQAALAAHAGAQTAPVEGYCPACGGSGEVVGMEGAGPDVYEVAVPCPHCDGRGGLADAYAGVCKLLAAEREKYMQACGQLYHAAPASAQDQVARDKALRERVLEEACQACEHVMDACRDRNENKPPEICETSEHGAGLCVDAVQALKSMRQPSSTDATEGAKQK